MAICLLRAIQNELLTRDFLLSRGVVQAIYAYYAIQQVRMEIISSSLAHSTYVVFVQA